MQSAGEDDRYICLPSMVSKAARALIDVDLDTIRCDVESLGALCTNESLKFRQAEEQCTRTMRELESDAHALALCIGHCRTQTTVSAGSEAHLLEARLASILADLGSQHELLLGTRVEQEGEVSTSTELLEAELSAQVARTEAAKRARATAAANVASSTARVQSLRAELASLEEKR